MRRAALGFLLAASACSPRPRRAFPLGLLQPVSPRVAAEASRLGLDVAAHAPPGAATVPAGLAAASGRGEVAANWTRLRFLAASAAASGASGLFFRLPAVSAANDFLDYAEESQALDRVLREFVLVRQILEGGAPASAPFQIPDGVQWRAWEFQGRRYVLLVNSGKTPAPLRQESLVPWRALFSVRSDARQMLALCGTDSCLPPQGVLWLEGRLLPELGP